MDKTNKPKYNPEIHKRRSIRLKGYDYSCQGDYFITICTQNREHFFGKIENNEMVLNKAGEMVNNWWLKTFEKFPEASIDEYIIMPNHFHAIVQIKELAPVGADPRVCPNSYPRVCPDFQTDLIIETYNKTEQTPSLTPMGGSVLLGTIVQWFKTMTTNDYIKNVKQNNWPAFDKKLWQRNYFEHIIRNERSYRFISDYIKNNTGSWENDSLFS